MAVRAACFVLYADESEPVTVRGLPARRLSLEIDHDVRGRFVGLMFYRADESGSFGATRAVCSIGGVALCPEPLTVSGWSEEAWAARGLPPLMVHPGEHVSIDVWGPFDSVIFLVEKVVLRGV